MQALLIDTHKYLDKSNVHKYFYIFVLTHVFFWTLIPGVIRKNLPLDVIEGIAWGSQWQWGYYKHPFLAPWLTQLGALLSPATGWVIYLISQLCIATCFIAVWRLTLKFSTPVKAFYSVLLLEGVSYYTFTSTEFNPNILMIATWSLAYLAFYNAVTRQNLVNWILTGVICGLTIVSKYYSAVLLLSMLCFLVWNVQARKSFLNLNLYAGFLFFLLIISPNMLWLYKHHFASVDYAFSRAVSQHTFLSQITGTLRFIKGQLLDLLILMIIFFVTLFTGNKFKNNFSNKFDREFIIFLLWGPVLVTLVFPLLSGDSLRDMWGTPLFSLLGVFLVHSITDNTFKERSKVFQRRIYATMVLLLLIYSLTIIFAPFLKQRGSREYFPGRILAATVTELWRQTYTEPLRYVAGNTWLAGNVGFYSSEKPTVFLDADLQESPWVNFKKLAESGAVIVWDQNSETCQVPDAYQRVFPALICEKILTIPYQMTAKKYSVRIGVGFLPPLSRINIPDS